MFEDEPQARPEASAEAPGNEGAATPLAALEAERDQFKAIAQRAQADFINYKRRMEEERSVLVRNAANNVISRLLPVVDDLQRAVDNLPAEAPPSWSEGVKLVLQNLHALLSSEGVTVCDPAPGDEFDPAQHEAVYHQPTEAQPAGSVLTTVRRGYRTPDRVLRPAQVVVAAGAAQAPGTSGE